MIKPATIPSVTSILNTEFECLPFPNEILIKIFGYLDIQDISRSAKVSHQFNKISNDPSLWKSMEKLYIDGKRVPTEFLTYIIQKGITELCLFQCEILPPRVPGVKLTRPLNLKTLIVDKTNPGETLMSEILTSYSIEKVALRDCNLSFSVLISSVRLIGRKLRSLNLGNTLRTGRRYDLSIISIIVNTCSGLEELNMSHNSLPRESVDYLCENLTPHILKLDVKNIQYSYYLENIRMGLHEPWKVGLSDKNIRALVKRCPKLRVLDIRENENITYQGLVAISDGLLFLECLALPQSVGNELGLPQCSFIDNALKVLPYTINLSKLHALKSMKRLKKLLIGCISDWNEYHNIWSNILQSEIPHLEYQNILQSEKHEGSNSFEVAVTKTNDFRGVEFCPNCLQYEPEPTYKHKCVKK